jgi:amino acid transporter
VEELLTQFRTVWDIYIKFYTVFLSISVAAITFVAGTGYKGSRRIVAVAFIVQTLMTLGTTIGVGMFSRQTAKGLRSAIRELAGDDEADRCWIPKRLATYSALANSVGLAFFTILWIVIGWN